MKKTYAAFAGSFDPPTLGHIDIIRRASSLFDKLLVVTAENTDKTCMFSAQERLRLLQEITKNFSNVEAAICPAGTLLVDFLRSKNIGVIVRALRNGLDFEKERDMEAINKTLDGQIETVFLFCKKEFSFISSSAVRTLALYNGDISSFVSSDVMSAVQKKHISLQEKNHDK